MNPESLKEVLEKIQTTKIGIVGDFCLDAYWFIDESKTEISIETGKPTTPVRRQKYSLGGAGNVASNLTALGVRDVRAFGVIGNDPFGTEMIALLNSNGIDSRNVLTQENDWSTHVYIKPHIGDEEQSRIDFGNFNILSDETAERLIANLRVELHEVDLVIINQQVASGIHTPWFRQKLKEVIRQFSEKIFITDSREFTDEYSGAYRKMNDREAARLCSLHLASGESLSYTELINAAERLYDRYMKPLFITRGDRGSIVTDDKGILEIESMMITGRTDTVGAGDSYLAGVASALAAGFNPGTAGRLGNFAAGVTVQKLFQTGTASPEEVIAIGSDADYVYHPDLAEDIRQAKYHPDSEIEIITTWHKPPEIKHAIFDNDGTISTFRQGWEYIMAPMMVRAILGDRYDDAGETTLKKVRSAVDDLIDKTTGIQTLRQMLHLGELVREFGFVAEGDILDAHGYKEIYNEDLLAMVRRREAKLRRGEISTDDLSIKNAIPFLKVLYEKGIRLWLTSGTDTADVRHEAEVLGYAYLFEERIFGATGDIDAEAKKMVLDSILDSIGKDDAASIITFGDGPVEIRETHKRGGLTAGVASNELRRYGLNPSKRTRLIKAGADIVIPDFAQPEILLGLLNIR
ncbi:MAG: carbohydrate kinase [Bacteroidales bacterium]|jgi:rfaE bifunctional protein kinase chain/domain|nr:carbohydrate kinase [Bacteroidales bacterium]HNY52043.1 PfkB family carbohydrate kinase [Bacteroidales bacterium]HPV16756.1 PfkB family carbohydrate kinase [Bacteroidales bacterium]HPX42877.1 PfkB family carbohydrate kinase [Bacteroidales bacterium]HQB85492.1 PfkB family carbohydrate kinase [Bacteroidales bacterium]